MRIDMRVSRKASIAVWAGLTLLFFGLISVAVNAQDGSLPESVEVGLGNRLFILILAAIIALISRAFLMRRLNKLMLSESKKAEGFETDLTPKPEIRAHQELKLVEKDIHSDFSEKGSKRESLMAQGRKGINRQFLTQLIIVAAYAAGFYFVAEAWFPEYITSLYNQNEDLEAIRRPILNYQIYQWLLKILFALTVLQFVANRYYFSDWGRGRFGFLVQGFWGQALTIMVLLFTIYWALNLFSMVMLAPIVLHLFLWWQLKRSGRKRPNTKLLILRVFLLKKTSKFTFNGLVKAWKHFGNYFTAADPSYYKVALKRKFRHTFPVFILAVFFLYTLIEDSIRGAEGAEVMPGVFIFFLIIGSIIYILNGRSRLKRMFMGSPESLAKRLGTVEHKPVKVDNTFKELPVMCYDNTWRQAVDGMIDTADVVLMDLRGFSEKNVSSAWEINVLFDTVPSNRIVFMAYEDTIPLVKRIIDQQWEMLAEDSPNLKTADPYTTVYTVTKENRKDLQGVLATLLESARSD